MAFCSKCRKQIPEDAAHCVHCGAAVAKRAVEPKRTVLGFGPQDKQRLQRLPSDAYKATMFSAEDQSQPAEVVPAAPSGAPAGAPRSPDAYKPMLDAPSSLPLKGSAPSVSWGSQAPESASPSEPSQEFLATMMAEPSQQPAAQPSQEFLATMMAQPGQQPAAQQPSKNIPATMMAQPSQLPAGQLQQRPVPATIMAQPGQVLAANGAAPATQGPDTAARLVLASHSIAAEANPVEPGRGKLRWLLIGGGLLLLISFCLPTVITDDGVAGFTWQRFSSLKGISLISQIYLAVGGALMILLGALPLPYVARGIMALILSLIPLTLASVGGTWRSAVGLFALLLLCGGLLHRYRYRGSKLSRVLVAVGVVGVLVTLLVPLQGAVPLVGVFEQFGNAASASQVVSAAVMPLLLLALALLSLLAFLGPESSALANLWAICLLLYLPLNTWLVAVFALAAGGKSLEPVSLGLASLVYLAVGAVGLAHLLTMFSKLDPRNQPS